MSGSVANRGPVLTLEGASDRASAMEGGQDGVFKGRHFTSEAILWALRRYLAFPIICRGLASMPGGLARPWPGARPTRPMRPDKRRNWRPDDNQDQA